MQLKSLEDTKSFSKNISQIVEDPYMKRKNAAEAVFSFFIAVEKVKPMIASPAEYTTAWAIKSKINHL